MNIVVDHVTKTIHRAVVLQDISLNFESGKVYGLQGENGSGKTMLLRLMCGLIYATEGSVSVNDRRLGKDLDFPESVGVMIESPAFIDEYTGQKNLELLAGLKQLISVSDIHNTLQAVGLEGVYPCGEGAGYAGGIMSAAVDGLRVAQQMLADWKFA